MIDSDWHYKYTKWNRSCFHIHWLDWVILSVSTLKALLSRRLPATLSVPNSWSCIISELLYHDSIPKNGLLAQFYCNSYYLPKLFCHDSIPKINCSIMTLCQKIRRFILTQLWLCWTSKSWFTLCGGSFLPCWNLLSLHLLNSSFFWLNHNLSIGPILLLDASHCCLCMTVHPFQLPGNWA